VARNLSLRRWRDVRKRVLAVALAAVVVAVGISVPSESSSQAATFQTYVTPRLQVNGDAPKILGTPKVGQTLTAQLTNWTIGSTFVYTWARGACSAIPGQVVGPYTTVATGSQFVTYKPTATDRGKCFVLRVDVSKTGYDSNWKVSSATTMVMQDFTTVPTPTISGIPQVGQTLTADPLTWVPAATPSFAWYADSAVISGQTANSLNVAAEYVGKTISVVVTGRGVGLTDTPSSSRATARVTYGPVPTTAIPTIEGTAASGQTLTANPGTWSPGTFFGYQWYQQPVMFGIPTGIPVAIKDATRSTLFVTSTLVGYALSVRVTGAKYQYLEVTRASNPTERIIKGDFSVSANPTISGRPVVGATLTVDPKIWSPTQYYFSYSWSRGSTAFMNSSVPDYTVQAADLGKTLTVAVTGKNSNVNDKTTYASITILGSFTTTTAPSIASTPAPNVGNTLIGLPGSWTPASTQFTYRWLVDGVPVPNAQGTSLTLTPDMLYRNVDFEVTPVLSGYFSEPRKARAYVREPLSTIEAGGDHSCALTSLGAVKCWGLNSSGQLGDGTRTNRDTPTPVTDLTSNVAVVSAGEAHTCAVTVSGAAYCWGSNANGQLGDGTQSDRVSPVQVSGLGSGVVSISAGSQSTCALLTGGSVMCWGENRYGQIGDATTTMRTIPTQVVGLTSGAKSVSVGGSFACAITSGDAVWCWGVNTVGQLGSSAGQLVYGTLQQSTPSQATGLSSGIRAISAGASSACAVNATGGALCWGYNSYGTVGDSTFVTRNAPTPVTGLASGVSRVSVGDGVSCATQQAGTVTCWGLKQGAGGANASVPSTTVWGTSSYLGLSTGSNFTCVITSASWHVCRGTNSYVK